METPNTRAGRITETIMYKLTARWPDIDVADHNRIYDTILEVLSLEFPPDSGVVKYPQGGGMFINRK